MNVLKNTKAYLAGNLENTVDSQNWRTYVSDKLSVRGIKSLSPVEMTLVNQVGENDEDRLRLKKERSEGKYDEVSSYMKTVVQKDLRLIDLSDFLIINLELSKPTYGTTHELVVATQQKKPIFLSVGDKRECPLWILGIIKHKYIYNNVDEILTMIYQIDSGIKKIESSNWRLLLPEFR